MPPLFLFCGVSTMLKFIRLSLRPSVRRSLASLCVLALFLEITSCALRRPKSTALLSTPSQANAQLQEKLAAQFVRFKTAKDRIIEKVGIQEGTMTREQWEPLFDAPPSEAFSPEDLADLRRYHDEIIATARLNARRDSVLDLDKVRAAGKVAEFCAGIPKGGMLHVHPYGTLDDDTVGQILEAVNPVVAPAQLASQLTTPGTPAGILYPDELDYLRGLSERVGETAKYLEIPIEDRLKIRDFFFLPAGAHSFDRFNGVFTVISKMIFANNQVDPEPMMYEGFFRRASHAHLDYVEITTFTRPGAQWVNSLKSWAKDVKERHGITAKLVAAFNRTKPLPFTRTKVKQLLDQPTSPVLVGVNLLADETNAPALEAGQTLYAPVTAAFQQGRSSLHRTIHAGELGDVRNVRDAILMGAERIGHGVKLDQDPVTLEYVRLQKIPVEINLLSNLRLKVVDDLKSHPFIRYLRLNIPVSLSTDDEGIFRTTINDECQAAIDSSDVTYFELKNMFLNGILTSFASEEEKGTLRQSLEEGYAAFETSWQGLARSDTASQPLSQ